MSDSKENDNGETPDAAANQGDDLSTSDSELKPRSVTIGVLAASVIALVGAIVYGWLLHNRWEHLEKWGAAGDSVAPLTALINAGALLAALWSIAAQRQELRLQRNELRLQRREFEMQREEMQESRQVFEAQQEQLTRTAAAQERLAEAEEAVAREQRNANRATASLEHAQRCATIAQLHLALATLDGAITNLSMAGSHGQMQVDITLRPRYDALSRRLELEERSERQLRDLMARGQT
ncbi:uncharacterized protein SOCE26_040290 [Sorangium cellulosum]|uniref:Uncharacterized protein n=1 Tax=Sorangium cellulosum TaxID=56 RepID=A0A2L0ETG6_SORCE|nr:hypothetical protein [Sorangium cellulosum]AUX42596.1 uncharacterized protein SOCE26_040290 [Sorangium cellulosum]